MSAIRHGWSNANANRQYPIAMHATAIDDLEQPLPHNTLLDVNMYVPKALGATNVYLGSISVAPSLTSAVLVGATASGPIPLGMVLRRAGSTPFTTIQPMATGVRGWATLASPRTSDTGKWVFSSAAQAELADGCVKRYNSPSVTAVGTPNRSPLTGDVSVLAEGDLVVSVEQRLISGRMTRTIVLSMDPTLPAETKAAYLAQCLNVSGVCSPDVIQFLNRVPPSPSGNIDIEVVGIEKRLLVDENGVPVGVAVESPLGLIDICEADKGMSGDDLTSDPICDE